MVNETGGRGGKVEEKLKSLTDKKRGEEWETDVGRIEVQVNDRLEMCKDTREEGRGFGG